MTNAIIVSEKKLGLVLDQIQAANGITTAEVAGTLKISMPGASAAINILITKGCVSKGSVQYIRKNGKIGLKPGYFYENDLTN